MVKKSKTAKIVKKKNIGKFLDTISNEYSVFVPTGNNDDDVSFQRYCKDSFTLINYSNSFLPPQKCFLFPPIWKKFIKWHFEDTKNQTDEEKALFGMRPCDAQSLTLLDRALNDNEFYIKKRKKLLTIVTGCNSPRKSCFCTSVKGSPFLTENADIFITDTGNNFILEDISEKGTKYLTDLPDAGTDDLEKKEKIKKRSFESVGEIFNLEVLPEKLEKMEKMPETEAVWKKLSDSCSNCAQCISICPTCHCCFVLDDIVDMVVDEVGEKVAKEWDPCMCNIFMSAGLSGPPPEGYQRTQRRLMDKFCHSAKTLGQPFCVGCGRCIVNCEEKLNLKETLKVLIELKIH